MSLRPLNHALALILAMAPLGAHAAEGKDVPPNSVQFSAVALPVVVDNRLINYVFVTVKLDLSPTADNQTVRAKEPFFRDALVRAGHRTPFTVATDYTKLDPAKMRAEVMNDAQGLVGRGVVTNVEIVKQVSQHRSDLPNPAAHAKGPDLVP